MKKFIMYDLVSEDKGFVNYMHYKPLDAIDGLPQEQLSKGVLVDEIPQPDPSKVETQCAKLYIKPSTKEFYYEYVDREFNIEEKIAILEAENANINYALMMKGII
jgi:hypothetical protein